MLFKTLHQLGMFLALLIENLTKTGWDNTCLSHQKGWKSAFPGVTRVINYVIQDPESVSCFTLSGWFFIHVFVTSWFQDGCHSSRRKGKSDTSKPSSGICPFFFLSRNKLSFSEALQHVSQSITKETKTLGQCSCKGSWKCNYPSKRNVVSLTCSVESWSIPWGYARAGHISLEWNLCSINEEERVKAIKSIFTTTSISQGYCFNVTPPHSGDKWCWRLCTNGGSCAWIKMALRLGINHISTQITRESKLLLGT